MKAENPTNERNRPMLDADLDAVEASPWAQKVRALVHEYSRDFLPVMNGTFQYSNLREGDDHVLTCLPYRLWEYSSLFLASDEGRPWGRALDVGGAASPLPYLLAENGIATHAVDLQPLLVDVCNHVARARQLPLEAFQEDVTSGTGGRETYDVITFISVLEHIDPSRRRAVFEGLYRRLSPGGLLYFTFDYGTYVEQDSYRLPAAQSEHYGSSVADIAELCAMIEDCGFEMDGNDPRTLPADVLARTRAPGASQVQKRFAMNAGPLDAATPWSVIGKYLLRRLLGLNRPVPTRWDRHNYFRMYVRRPK